MERLAFYFDMTRCVGCKTCQIACKQRNSLPIGINYRKVRTYEVGEYPSARMYHLATTCNHCEEPMCVANCSSGAMYKAEDGTVQHNDAACIGCETCVQSCPYFVPQFIPELNVVGKCYACKDTRDVDGAPTCVLACGQRALDFGTYEELLERHPEAVSEIAVLADSSLTTPNVLISAKPAAFEEEYREIVL